MGGWNTNPVQVRLSDVEAEMAKAMRATRDLLRRKPCGHLVYYEGCFCESDVRPKE